MILIEYISLSVAVFAVISLMILVFWSIGGDE